MILVFLLSRAVLPANSNTSAARYSIKVEQLEAAVLVGADVAGRNALLVSLRER